MAHNLLTERERDRQREKGRDSEIVREIKTIS